MQINYENKSLYLNSLSKLPNRMEQIHFGGKIYRTSKFHSAKNLKKENKDLGERNQLNPILFFINLFILLAIKYLHCSVFLDLANNLQQKGYLIGFFMVMGFIFALISSVQIASWREIFRMYFLLDSLVPVTISAVIGFYTLMKFISDGNWYNYVFMSCFPFWVFYFSSYLRVILAYLRWSRWQIVLFKLALLGCGSVNFYVGFTYMKGAYKISMGYDKSLDETVKGLIYLYLFGLVQLDFMFFRRISDFDQTNKCKNAYQFDEDSEKKEKRIKTVTFPLHQREKPMFKEIKRQSKYCNIMSVEEGSSQRS